ncbi:MAG: threonylcarbamoyl-AMP synthase [Bacteroidia bacterium]|nr:threonylcarbamoyl-AMP synthase [Bacteroidia bacterium]
MAETGKNTDLAADYLLHGKLVAIPTETVYGLAANALNPAAVLSVFETKQRPHFDPLIIHVPSLQKASEYAVFDDDRLLLLAQKFWPGPLTLLLPKKEMVPDLVTSGLNRVAVRVPDHELTLELLNKINLPLAAPSANPFGYVSPTEPAHVQKQLGDKIAYILDGGNCRVGLESTIVGVEEGKLCVYRLGGLAIEEIETVAGPVVLHINQSSNPKAPGQLKSHYAPRKPLYLGETEELLKLHATKKCAVICFGGINLNANNVLVYNLSPGGDVNEAALNLFRYLRAADDSTAEIVICQKLPEIGLGRAINDRLIRAAVAS